MSAIRVVGPVARCAGSGLDDEACVAVVDAGQSVAEADRGSGSDASGQLEHVPFAAATGQQRAPRSHRAFTETFGTSRVDFDAPLTAFTFSTRDLDIPVPGADPALARILTRYADTLSPPPSSARDQEFPVLPTREPQPESLGCR